MGSGQLEAPRRLLAETKRHRAGASGWLQNLDGRSRNISVEATALELIGERFL